MSRTDAFEVEGIVVDALPNLTYRVRLANGHELCAFVAGRARLTTDRFAPGQKVMLQVSPFDLSEGRIVLEKEKRPTASGPIESRLEKI